MAMRNLIISFGHDVLSKQAEICKDGNCVWDPLWFICDFFTQETMFIISLARQVTLGVLFLCELNYLFYLENHRSSFYEKLFEMTCVYIVTQNWFFWLPLLILLECVN